MMVNFKVNGEYKVMQTAQIGSKIFEDDSRTIFSMSPQLVGSYMAQLGWDDMNSTSFSVSSDSPFAVIVSVWVDKWYRTIGHNDLINMFEPNGWTLKKKQKITYENLGGYGEPAAILSKTESANRTIFLNKPKNSSPITIFVTQGESNKQTITFIDLPHMNIFELLSHDL